MPEGDALHLAARRLQVLVGEQLEVETPHPRAAVKQLAPRLDGRRLDGVEAIGKNLLLRFEGGLVLRSHLRMKGRWRVFPRESPILGTPWLVLRGREYVGAMFNGAVLELGYPSLETLVRLDQLADPQQQRDSRLAITIKDRLSLSPLHSSRFAARTEVPSPG